ncbi:MAG: Sec-independent protein translocase protein TatB [Alphaproteobacteria bacterium]
MLDIGWNELLIVALVTIIVVGPKELPRVLRTVTKLTSKLRSMASEFQSGIDDLAREAELDDLKKSIEDTASRDLEDEIESALDPTGEFTDSVHEIGESIKQDPRDTGPEILDADTVKSKAAAKPAARKRKPATKKKAAPAAKKKSSAKSKSPPKRAAKSAARVSAGGRA